MKSRKIQDKFEIIFDDGSIAHIEAEYKAMCYDGENKTSEAFKFVDNVNVSYTVNKNSMIDSLLQALGDKALSKCAPEVGEDNESES
jgi:hypothetical protein